MSCVAAELSLLMMEVARKSKKADAADVVLNGGCCSTKVKFIS
jgi:hypothetical protein